jgi:preprotein translocase subunit YajC
MQDLLPLAFIAIVFVGFYVLIIRPAQRRQREAQAVFARLAVGQEVMTTAGIYGVLRGVAEDTVTIEVADGVQLRYARAAIARIVDDPAVVAGDDVAGESSGDEGRTNS